MAEWKRVRLGEVADLLSGFPFDGHKYSSDGVRVVRGENVSKGKLRWNADKRWNEPFEKESIYSLRLHDVVVSMDGNVGKNRSRILKDDLPLLLAQRVARLRAKESVADQLFLYYCILSQDFEQYIDSIKTGTTISHISLGQLSEYEIPLPPLATQKKIAAVLGAIDDKIETNRKICANLEAQAQALFKSWFVDFEPFGGKMLDDDIWGTHPRDLKYVKVSSLNPILETGSRPKGGATSSGMPSIGAENVKRLGVVDFSAAKFIPYDYANQLKRGRIHGYELLLYKDGGKPGMFKPHFSMFGEGFPYQECFINEHVFKVDFGSREINVFAYFYFKSHNVFHWLETNGSKAAIPGINQSNVLDVMMPDPSNILVQAFGSKVLPLFKRIFIASKESRALASMRDALLPRLMSGEIDVEKVEVA